MGIIRLQATVKARQMSIKFKLLREYKRREEQERLKKLERERQREQDEEQERLRILESEKQLKENEAKLKKVKETQARYLNTISSPVARFKVKIQTCIRQLAIQTLSLEIQ